MIWPFDRVPTTTSSAPMTFQSCQHLTALGELPEPTASRPPINMPLSILLLRLPGPGSAPQGQAASRHPHRAVLLLPCPSSPPHPATIQQSLLFPDQTHAPTVHPMTLTNICKYSFCGCEMNGSLRLFPVLPEDQAPTSILPTTASLALSTPCVLSDMSTQGSKT